MLFNSYLFIFVFLPLTLLGYYLAAKWSQSRIAITWLVSSSLLFYGWYNPVYVVLISCSILFNYIVGIILTNRKVDNQRKLVMALGVTINILLLGYFKYANFFVENANAIFYGDFHLNAIILPIAISFITLQQIAYLVDVYRGEVVKHGFLNYCLFITFFPKLMSGPIVRFEEMMPQVIKDHMPKLTLENVALGLAVFFLGLFKKVILADNIGAYATPVFDAATEGAAISFFNSWSGALAYSFQLYFDFSGYCDMAIGLGLLFGIRLPLNFYSPYKATSIIDFWHRWHMTLFRFLRDYLYIPLGGNRKGFPRQMVNLLFIMVIAGFWHGAGWTFIVWGALHGMYLVINHGWRRLRRRLGQDPEKTTSLGTTVSILITFIAVITAWVFFRADSIGAATAILKGMTGMNGFGIPAGYYEKLQAHQLLWQIRIIIGTLQPFWHTGTTWIFASIIICWFLPNAQEYMSNYKTALDSFGKEAMPNRWLRWKPSLWSAIVIAGIATLAISNLSHVSKFIYFQF